MYGFQTKNIKTVNYKSNYIQLTLKKKKLINCSKQKNCMLEVNTHGQIQLV